MRTHDVTTYQLTIEDDTAEPDESLIKATDIAFVLFNAVVITAVFARLCQNGVIF